MWTRYGVDGTGRLAAVGQITSIEVVLEADGDWSEPTTVVETDDWFDSTPVVVPLDEGWVVAWERADTDDDSQAVGYAVLNATGAVERTSSMTCETALFV